MESLGRQAGERESFVHTPEFESLKGLRSPESDSYFALRHLNLLYERVVDFIYKVMRKPKMPNGGRAPWRP